MKRVLRSKWFYFALIFLFMLTLNYMTPYIQDDYQYMYDFTGTKKITSLYQILRELYHMYFNWGGRVLAHFFAFSFLALPKWIFNIINSIIYVLNVYLIYLICRGNKKNQYYYLLFAHMLIFIFFPVFGQVFLWLDGSCNYSFTLMFQLLFIYSFIHIDNNSWKKIILLMILGVLAGMCNENSSLAIIFFTLVYSILHRDYLRVRIFSFVGNIAGYLFLFLAPGNYVRMAARGSSSFFTNFLDKLLFLFIDFWPIIIGFFIFLFVFYKRHKEEGKVCILYYLAALVSFFSMIASPQLSLRSFTITVIYLILIVLIMFINLSHKNMKRFGVVVLSSLFIFVFISTFYEYYQYHSFMMNREVLIKKAINNHYSSVVLPIYQDSSNCRIPASCDLHDISFDKEEFPNIYMSKYYGIDIYGEE